MGQLAISNEQDKKVWYKRVIQRLKDYKCLLDSIELYTIAKECGRLDLISLEEREKEERNVQYKKLEIHIMQKALAYLDYDMLLIVENCYLKKDKQKDIAIMLELGMGHSTFYKRKDEAIRKLAMVLNMI